MMCSFRGIRYSSAGKSNGERCVYLSLKGLNHACIPEVPQACVAHGSGELTHESEPACRTTATPRSIQSSKQVPPYKAFNNAR